MTESIERIVEQMRLANKGILVTGAASGMGRVATRMFAEQGAKVIAADLNESGLNGAISEIDAGYHDAILPVVGNVAVSDDVRRFVESGVKHFGSLNVLYNNAGI